MSDDRLRELGRHLPWDRPDAERREAVRSSLLVAATQADPDANARKRWLLVGGGFMVGAVAAAAIAVVVIAPAKPQTRQAHARIDAPSTAQLEHTVAATATGTDEVVRIRAGVVRMAVPAIARGNRVRMQTSDAEVEGIGTYEVAVVDDRLERVTVAEGTARVTTRAGGEQRHVFLATGQTWRATIITADIDLPPATTPPRDARAATTPSHEAEARDSAPRESTPRQSTRSPTATSTAPAAPASPTPATEAPRMPAVTELDVPPPPPTATKSKTEVHFQAGWALLREGKAREAAVELGAAADASPGDPLAADARYFQAVALVRAGEAREAERVLVAFLDAAPTSLRRGRAAILLGKLVRDRGDATSARAWFESATRDADPAIAAAAKAHLDALSRR